MKLKSIQELATRIVENHREMPAGQAMLVGISGIDASGKGYIASRLADELESAGHRVALMNIDGWLDMPERRFSDVDPGRHFYLNALRLDEAFEKLILPLQRDREIDITIDFADETAFEFRPHRYLFSDVNIILLEGIFLFKREYVHNFDLRIWIECSFETALSRAVTRSQEALSPADTARVYEEIYFPAQRHHFEIDDPAGTADLIIADDQRA